MSWGPLIHGHAPRGLVQGAGRGRARRHELRRAEPARSRARRARPRADAVDRARALRQLRHRSDDERACASRAPRPAASASSSSRAATTATPIAFLVQAGSGALTLGVPTSPGVTRGAAADTLRRRLQRPRLGAAASSTRNRDQIAAVIVEPIAGNMGVVPPADGFLRGAARASARAHGALLIFDEVISGFRAAAGRRAGARRRAARPDVPRQDHRRRPAGRRLRRPRGSDGARVAGRARSTRRARCREIRSR